MTKEPRWGKYNGVIHLFRWWKPDKYHWGGLIEGKNRPIPICVHEEGLMKPESYHEVEWCDKGKLVASDHPGEVVCVHCLMEVEKERSVGSHPFIPRKRMRRAL